MIMGPVSKNEMNRLTALSPFHFLSDYSFYYRSCSTKKIMDKPFNHKDWNSLVIRILTLIMCPSRSECEWTRHDGWCTECR